MHLQKLDLQRALVFVDLQRIHTFWFMRLGEGEVCKNVAWKLHKCYGVVEGGDGDRKPVCKYFEKKRISKVYLGSISRRTHTNRRRDFIAWRATMCIGVS